MNDIEKIIQQSDKAEFLEWAKDNISEAIKGMVIFAYDDGKGGLNLLARQFGFKYLYELNGFFEWSIDAFFKESDDE